MLFNLFSVFDPVSLGISMNWIVILFMGMIFLSSYYGIQDKSFLLYEEFKMKLMKTISGVLDHKYKFVIMMSFVLCMFIFMMNLLGLFPYVFPMTAHFVMTLTFGLVLWVSGLMMGVNSKSYKIIIHLTPEGCPLVLSPFLVMIESVSLMIRPMTLSLRLAANMVAGHLIVGLLASIMQLNLFILVSVMLQSVMLVMEVGVSLIQGMVFSILFLLYMSDYY